MAAFCLGLDRFLKFHSLPTLPIHSGPRASYYSLSKMLWIVRGSRMLGGIIAVFVTAWFFTTAQKIPGKDPIFWGAIGLGAYYLVVTLWVVITDIGFLAEFHHKSITIGLIVHYLGPALGVVAAWFIRRYWLLRAPSEIGQGPQ